MAFTVDIRRYTEGETDAHGNPIVGHSDPEPLVVTSIAPRYSNEPTAGRSEVVVGLTVYAAPSTAIGPHDIVVIDGVEYEVEGEVADWTRGRYGYTPGISVNLKRAGG